jgi:hypothetical protein
VQSLENKIMQVKQISSKNRLLVDGVGVRRSDRLIGRGIIRKSNNVSKNNIIKEQVVGWRCGGEKI